MTSLRSRIRPIIYKALSIIGYVVIAIPIGFAILVLVVATSFFWIPLAVLLWFEEEPVWEGLKHWFLNVLLKPEPMGGCFRL